MLIPVACIAMAANAQTSRPTRWRTFVSERWGFRMQLPEDWRIELTGPTVAGCSRTSRTIAIRPSWVVLRRGDDVDTMTVSFTRASFGDIATDEGFARVDSAWFYGSDSATIAHGRRWQSIEGHDTERVDHPDAAPGEPSFDFDDVFRAVARFDRGDGCALVLSVRKVGHIDQGESLGALWSRVGLLGVRHDASR